MEKILIIGCKRTMNEICIGCSRCMVAYNRKEGAFEVYKNGESQLIGILSCGDCPGASIVPRLAQFNLWNKPMTETPTKVHVAACITDHCPYKDTLLAKIKAVVGVEVIEGAHPYMPQNIFG
ncbi:CGGC domain-containing protein [bacterium]|nr:CGGC domain-containing protein [bacterium]